MSGKKNAPFTKEGIEILDKNKPVVYDIKDKKGNYIYIGSAKRGRVEARLKEHLPGGKDPIRGGFKVIIHQKSSIADAKKSEAKAIKAKQPSQNKRGK